MIPFNALCRNDQQTICHLLHLPLPTPDVTLDMIIAQEKIQPATILVRLERSRQLSAMIAAAALRGQVTKCPNDMQLTPKPYPKAPVRAPKGEAETSRVAAKPAVKAMSATRTLVSFVANPKRPGTAARERYAKYKVGCTEAQLLELGLWRSDFRHDTSHGFIVWSE